MSSASMCGAEDWKQLAKQSIDDSQLDKVEELGTSRAAHCKNTFYPLVN